MFFVFGVHFKDWFFPKITSILNNENLLIFFKFSSYKEDSELHYSDWVHYTLCQQLFTHRLSKYNKKAWIELFRNKILVQKTFF
jgi:hypothetical protein